MDIFNKCRNYTIVKEVIASGNYPFFKAIESQQDTVVVIEGKRVIMIGSNNYLGLTSHPKVKEAAIEAIKRYGTGCTGSRFLNGTLDIHRELEKRLAKFLKKETALVFSTGFTTNIGTISALVGKDDLVIIDRQNHASIVDGCRLSFGKTVKFKHNDMEDLERILKNSDNFHGKLVIVDGVFSMLGDLALLQDIGKLCKKYGAGFMVDDAHGIGVLGENGRGTAEYFGVEDDVDIIMGTFSKSFASLGGFIASSEEVINYVKHNARSLIFSASMPPASVAVVLAALDIIENEPERREKIWKNRSKMMAGYKMLGFNTGETQTPIIPIIIGDDDKTFALWKSLFENGVYTNAIISPAVPSGMSLLRTSLMATHTDEHLDKVLKVMEKVGKHLNII